MSETISNLYHVQINEEIERCNMLSSSERRKFERVIVDTEYYKEIYLNIWKKISDEAQKFNGNRNRSENLFSSLEGPKEKGISELLIEIPST
jgi:hypothetical protein